jgi:hypothetical protein
MTDPGMSPADPTTAWVAPSLCIAPDRIIAALIAEPAKLLEDPD